MSNNLKTRPDGLENKRYLFETKFSIHSDRKQSKSISLVTLNIFEETRVFLAFKGQLKRKINF